MYENGRRSSISAEKANATNALDDGARERELEMELADVRAEMATVKQELSTEKEHVYQFKAISQANEEALASLSATFDAHKADLESKLAESQSVMHTLNQKKDEINNALAKAVEELSAIQDTFNEERSSLLTHSRDLEAQLKQSALSEQDAILAKTTATEDLSRQQRAVAVSQQNYERELMNHAEDVKALTLAKDEILKIKQDYMQVKVSTLRRPSFHYSLIQNSLVVSFTSLTTHPLTRLPLNS